jgi:hypothetical protein
MTFIEEQKVNIKVNNKHELPHDQAIEADAVTNIQLDLVF